MRIFLGKFSRKTIENISLPLDIAGGAFSWLQKNDGWLWKATLFVIDDHFFSRKQTCTIKLLFRINRKQKTGIEHQYLFRNKLRQHGICASLIEIHFSISMLSSNMSIQFSSAKEFITTVTAFMVPFLVVDNFCVLMKWVFDLEWLLTKWTLKSIWKYFVWKFHVSFQDIGLLKS